ncbi:IclR family transcriptional regulator [Streptomyces griseoviridis]|uniref:IclR family transcriptional regulator n=1 Tax=Streptomyces hintoniae TaxID=3075521 RepID=A0ABU2UKJ8_9ACTN|nr:MULTISPECIES: IclR family transcriptional regulator [unclassified Streptomyces]MDH6699234.1 IclR family acetate operon transcriptional repressor [Streptomyces sp. MAA16]MDT0473779.1 IclR family transcriptional regulator [Streptomyces sp. DSM 41014]
MQNNVGEGLADEASHQPKYWVKTVGRAAEILQVLASGGPGQGLSVTEIGNRCGISKSAAFGILQTLRHYGLVADEGEGMNRRYRLGMGLARLGERAQDQVSLRDVARPVLRRLSAECALASRVAVPESGHAVVIDQVDLDTGPRLDLRMGTRELAHCSGLGKALLAALPEDEARALIARAGLPRRTSRTITDEETLFAHLRDIRAAGYALDDEEDADGIFCIGSVVRDHAGRTVGAISVTGLKLDLPGWRFQELGRQVRAAAGDISRELGAQEEKPQAAAGQPV